VIVAVVAVAVVKVTLHDIVRVIAVRNRFVSAPGAVMVLCRVPVVEARRAARGVLRAHADAVVLHASTLLMLEMTVIQVVDVALVLHGVMPARRAMDVLLSWG
jgi:hypothetical protein